jgi:hypothetical protein
VVLDKMIKRQRRVHPVFQEWSEMLRVLGPKPELVNMQTLGKYQYLYEDEKANNLVSLVEFPTVYEWMFHGPMWEMMCIRGQLFEGEERFATRQEAEEKLGEYFKDKDDIVDEEFRLPEHFYQPYGGQRSH